MPHEHRRNLIGQTKKPYRSKQNHSHFVDYQQGKLNSVDKPSLEDLYAVWKNLTRINQTKKVKIKSIIYLYAYAKIFSPLYLV